MVGQCMGINVHYVSEPNFYSHTELIIQHMFEPLGCHLLVIETHVKIVIH